MNEIIFESSGNIEYFTDPEMLQDDTEEKIEEQFEEDPEEQLEEDPEEEDPKEQLEDDPEEQLEKDPEEVKEENTEEGNKNDVLQVSDVQTDIYTSDDPEHVSDNQIVIVSENIISKPLNDYSVSESLQLYIFISLFVAGFIVLVRRAVLKWS